ncbi:HprK-related kinase B [Hydrogenovibrio thermophilus]|uniref:HprK-related kinase B n=1 Tax=Hydrogenovibrio thermophilus TaxID=265883 RepID=A0A410H4P2_9GAMM|nr:HprK-related kinase B [Hydrogenovibrio thermophilus]QAB15889.1 HprK-related kinase B [Hydrogenovibrio thermophilus]
MPLNLVQQISQFQESTPLQPQRLSLSLPGWTLAIESNSKTLLTTLQHYFGDLLSESSAQADQTITAYETDQFLNQGLHWEDWKRETGKTGRKDAFLDFDNGLEAQRFIYKVKTGMLFWQRHDQPTAFGPTESHPNQIINFILTQYLNEHLRRDWLLGHAAGLQLNGRGLAIAGLSGGGKSTLMLHLLENGEHFISNDRLLFADSTITESARPDELWMRGIPKQPRINPGTIVHNSRLHALIPAERRAELLQLPREELRQLEEKYDADVNRLYHPNCFKAESPLSALVILNWQPGSDDATRLTETTLNDSPHLLPAIIKSPGPFYADRQNVFLPNQIEPDTAPYLAMLGDLPCWELNGNVDFAAAVRLVEEAARRQ